MHIYDKKHHVKTGTLINESFMIILLINWSNEILLKKQTNKQTDVKQKKKQHIFTITCLNLHNLFKQFRCTSPSFLRSNLVDRVEKINTKACHRLLRDAIFLNLCWGRQTANLTSSSLMRHLHITCLVQPTVKTPKVFNSQIHKTEREWNQRMFVVFATSNN